MFHLGFFLPRFAPLLPSVCNLLPLLAPLRFHAAPSRKSQGNVMVVARCPASWKWSPCSRARSQEVRVVDAGGIPFQSKEVPRGGNTRSALLVFRVSCTRNTMGCRCYMRRTTGHVFFTGASPASFPIRYKPSPDRYDLIKVGISNCEQSASVLSACNEHFLLSERLLD